MNIDFLFVIIEFIYKRVRDILENKKDGGGNLNYRIIVFNV